MSAALILSAVLAGPPSEAVTKTPPEPTAKPSADQGDVSDPKKPPKLEDVRKAYLEALQKSARRAKPKLPQVVPALTDVYTDLKTVEGLAHSERSKMRGRVKARMEELRDKLIRELLRNKKLADRQKRRRQQDRSKRVDERAEMLAGGGANAEAIKLIDLIQNTIEPESWQLVGGKGSIYYFDLLKVLVVRQTGEVHHQLGGVLEQLRR